MAKIFLTGATGYIGGDLLHLLAKTRPQDHIRALVRNSAKGDAVKKAYNQVGIVHGSLDDLEIISREARNADVVVQLAATGHLKVVEAIHKALVTKPDTGRPPFWIQISGGSVLAAPELANKSREPGSGSDSIYDDLSGIDAIQSLIKNHPSRAVDNYMLSVAKSSPRINTAVVAPPIIYGSGRGPLNQRSIQIPELSKAILKRQKGLQVGSGSSRWGNVHIQDLSQLLLRLIEKAVEGIEDDRVWGRNGFYLAGVGELSFGEISRRITTVAHRLNLLPDEDIQEISGEEVDELLPHGSVLYGTNARGRGNRAEAVLGWTPQMESLEDNIPRAVQEEAQALGLVAGPNITARL